MNPDMMPKRWWEDDDYWREYSAQELAKLDQPPSKKRDWLRDIYQGRLEAQLADDWGYRYDDWLEDVIPPPKKKTCAKRQACRFKEGQLVRARWPHVQGKDTVGIIIQSDLPRGAADSLSVRVMWPDGEVEAVAEDDLLMCKLDTAGL